MIWNKCQLKHNFVFTKTYSVILMATGIQMRFKFFSFVLLILFSLQSNAQWQLRSTGNYSHDTYCFIESSDTLLAGTMNGILASIDSGNTWFPSSAGLQSDSTIFCFGKNSTGIFAGGTNSIYFSVNNGSTWTNVNNNSGTIFEFAFLNDTTFAASMGNGVLMSVNNGATWIPRNAGLGNDSVYCIVTKGNLLFAGTIQGGIFMSSNSGVNWSAVNTNLPLPIVIRSLDTDGTNLYAGTCDWLNPSISASGMYISSNNGTSWAQVTTGIPNANPVFQIKSIGNAILAGAHDVYRSLDQGANWAIFMNGISPGCTYGAGGFYATSSYVFCGIELVCIGSVYRIDRGSVLSIIEINKSSISIFPNPAVDNFIVAWENYLYKTAITITDITGKTIYSTAVTDTQKVIISTKSFSEGIYFVQIQSTNYLETKKLVIER
ncbi:MAG: T9SS type A sorting domain-containing protein [Bacteroidetes bacterium]|nr:T9SS type A sorting domain-containing protein [Bacteroidota bacterium]